MTPLAAARLAEIRGRLDAATWQPEGSVPDVAAGRQERFIVAIRYEETDRVFVCEAEYLNGVLLQWSDDHPGMNDDGEVSCVGWFEREPNAEFDDYYQPIGGKCQVIGWMPLPPPPDAHAPTDVRELVAEVERLTEAELAWRKALHSLTPGGSEFMTPEACLAWLRQMKTDLIEGRIAAERAKQEAASTIARLEAEAAAVRAADPRDYFWADHQEEAFRDWRDVLDEPPPRTIVSVTTAKAGEDMWAVYIPTEGDHPWGNDCHRFDTEAEAEAAIRALPPAAARSGEGGGR
jgi:hypothetical protein